MIYNNNVENINKMNNNTINYMNVNSVKNKANYNNNIKFNFGEYPNSEENQKNNEFFTTLTGKINLTVDKKDLLNNNLIHTFNNNNCNIKNNNIALKKKKHSQKINKDNEKKNEYYNSHKNKVSNSPSDAKICNIRKNKSFNGLQVFVKRKNSNFNNYCIDECKQINDDNPNDY